MLRLDDNKFSKPFIYSVWLLMSFQAGYINVGGFLIFGNYVSHVTGSSSQVGIGMANFDFTQLVTFLSIILAFILGAAFSGYYIGRKKEENKEPQFILVTAVKAVLFGLVLILSEVHFSNPQEEIQLLLVVLLSVCCGIQNATCSQATNGFLKPTHMTGLSTDIGIHLTKIFSWRNDDKKFKEERNKNYMRMNILGSFIFGGFIAMLIFQQNGHYGFLFPFISSLCFLAVTILSESKLKEKSQYFYIAKKSIWGTVFATISFAVFQSIKY